MVNSKSISNNYWKPPVSAAHSFFSYLWDPIKDMMVNGTITYVNLASLAHMVPSVTDDSDEGIIPSSRITREKSFHLLKPISINLAKWLIFEMYQLKTDYFQMFVLILNNLLKYAYFLDSSSLVLWITQAFPFLRITILAFIYLCPI